MKQRASDEDIHAFIEAVYPGNASLVMATFDERLVLREATRQITELRAALRGILEIGKRDMSNTKYDGYFETARKALELQA